MTVNIRSKKLSVHDGETYIYIGETKDGDVLWLLEPLRNSDIIKTMPLFTFSNKNLPHKSLSCKDYGDLMNLDFNIMNTIGCRNLDVFTNYLDSIRFFSEEHEASDKRDNIISDLCLLVINCFI